MVILANILEVFLAVRTVVGENILEVFLAVRTVVGENILEVFLAVRMVVGENIEVALRPMPPTCDNESRCQALVKQIRREL